MSTMIVIIIIILFEQTVSLRNNYKNSNEKSKEDINEVIVKCVLKIIQNNFKYTPTVYINNSLNNKKQDSNDFENILAVELSTRNIPQIVSGHYVNTTSLYIQEGHTLSVIYIEDCKTILKLPNVTIERRVKYLIIIFDYSKERCDDILQIVGSNTSTFDFTYMANISAETYSVFTFKSKINETTCEMQYDLPPIVLSNCGYIDNFNTFPSKKLKNYMKCPLRIGMATMFPFATFLNESSLYNYKSLNENDIKGSDLETLRLMADKFNFTLEFYFVDRMEHALVSFLENGSLDLCAGGLYRKYGNTIEYAGVYGRQAIIWMYPAKRDTRSWQDFVKKVNGLYIFIIFYFVYAIICKLFSIFDKQPIAIGRLMLHTWGVLVGTSSLDDGTSLKYKILNIIYLIMSIHLSAYVSIQMFSFLTIASPPTIYKTNTDILQSGLRPYLMKRIKYFMKDKTYEAFANTSEDCATFHDCQEKSVKNNGVTVIIDGLFLAMQAETAVNDEAIILRANENLLTTYHEMLIRKDVPIIESFRKMVLRLGESGISDRLYDEAIGITIKTKAEIANKNIMSYSNTCEMGCSITLEQSAGAFYVWIVGCGLSFCVFVFEISYKREHNNVSG